MDAVDAFILYFNSHPHEEDDGMIMKVKVVKSISTHILTKRMTSRRDYIVGSIQFQLTSSRRG